MRRSILWSENKKLALKAIEEARDFTFKCFRSPSGIDMSLNSCFIPQRGMKLIFQD